MLRCALPWALRTLSGSVDTPRVLRRVMGYPAPQGTFAGSLLGGPNTRALPRSLIPNLPSNRHPSIVRRRVEQRRA